jgi:hypothetical protein
MNRFDLEKAKAGEPVEYLTIFGVWEIINFVGMTAGGEPVVQRDNGHLFETDCERLRMAPKKKQRK